MADEDYLWVGLYGPTAGKVLGTMTDDKHLNWIVTDVEEVKRALVRYPHLESLISNETVFTVTPPMRTCPRCGPAPRRRAPLGPDEMSCWNCGTATEALV
jgi:hypothetical protein